MKRKGAIVISETILVAFGVIISFILLSSLASMIFRGQSESAQESALAFVAKDIASVIDNFAGEAGSVQMTYKIPKGMKVNVTIDYKRVNVTAGKNKYIATFSALTHTKSYTLEAPNEICIVKNQNDMRISLTKGKCRCEMSNNACEPACIANDVCDPTCNRHNVEDNVCDIRCSRVADGICDRDCFTNDKDGVNEIRDCVNNFDTDSNGRRKTKDSDRICDGDSHLVEDNICDTDCLNNGTSYTGTCDPDCNKYDMQYNSGMYFSTDNYCDLDCGYGGSPIMILSRDGVCDLDCAGPINPDTGDYYDRIANRICDPDCGSTYDKDCIGMSI